MILISSCKTTQTIEEIDTSTAVIMFSKSKCLGSCPVYDLWVFKNGNVVYNGIANVSKKGTHKTTIPQSKLQEIETLFKTVKPNTLHMTKGRDKPKTTLKYLNKKVTYYETLVKGNYLKIDQLLQNIIKDI